MSKCLKCGSELPLLGDCLSCAADVAAPQRAPELLSRELTLDRRAAGRAQSSFQLEPPTAQPAASPTAAAAPGGFTRPVPAPPPAPVAAPPGAARNFTLPGVPSAPRPAHPKDGSLPWEESPLERILSAAESSKPAPSLPPRSANPGGTWPFAASSLFPSTPEKAKAAVTPALGTTPPFPRTPAPPAASPAPEFRTPTAPFLQRPPATGTPAPAALRTSAALPPSRPLAPPGPGATAALPRAPTPFPETGLEPRRSREVLLGLPPPNEESAPLARAPLLPDVPAPPGGEAPPPRSQLPGLPASAWERTDPQYLRIQREAAAAATAAPARAAAPAPVPPSVQGGTARPVAPPSAPAAAPPTPTLARSTAAALPVTSMPSTAAPAAASALRAPLGLPPSAAAPPAAVLPPSLTGTSVLASAAPVATRAAAAPAPGLPPSLRAPSTNTAAPEGEAKATPRMGTPSLAMPTPTEFVAAAFSITEPSLPVLQPSEVEAASAGLPAPVASPISASAMPSLPSASFTPAETAFFEAGTGAVAAPLPEARPSVRDIRARPASLWRRAGALLVDAAIVLGTLCLYLGLAALVGHPAAAHGPQASDLDSLMARLHAVHGVLTPAVVLGALLGVVYSSVFAFLWGGRTPGRWLFGIRLVDRRGLAPAPGHAVARAFLALVSFALCLAGFWLSLFDRRGQTLHDKLMRTFVVRPG